MSGFLDKKMLDAKSSNETARYKRDTEESIIADNETPGIKVGSLGQQGQGTLTGRRLLG